MHETLSPTTTTTTTTKEFKARNAFVGWRLYSNASDFKWSLKKTVHYSGYITHLFVSSVFIFYSGKPMIGRK